MDRIANCIGEYKKWCEKIGISTISDVNNAIENGKTNDLINISEIWHEQNISEIAQSIKDNINKKKIILISGPSSSGKTSFAYKLKLHLQVIGINAITISLDNYYIDIEKMPKTIDNKPNFEALESIDYKKFNNDVYELITKGKAIVPIYNFGASLNSEKTIELDKNQVIIVEGIHGLNDKVTENIPSENKYKIYCSALTALTNNDGTKIKSRTTRLIRRLIRDFYFRNSSYEYTFELWPDVEKGAMEYIYPYTDSADIIFNSSLLYEFAVYKKHLNNVFNDLKKDDLHFQKANELVSFVNRFIEIESDKTPHSSLIREFIGGTSLDI